MQELNRIAHNICMLFKAWFDKTHRVAHLDQAFEIAAGEFYGIWMQADNVEQQFIWIGGLLCHMAHGSKHIGCPVIVDLQQELIQISQETKVPVIEPVINVHPLHTPESGG